MNMVWIAAYGSYGNVLARRHRALAQDVDATLHHIRITRSLVLDMPARETSYLCSPFFIT
jgi:hypothetical protein